jgi:preprotein translocase subunit SecB
MTEENQNATEENAQQLPPLVMNQQYIKDLSFEMPEAPVIFQKITDAPDIDMGIDVRVERLDPERVYEITLALRLQGRLKGTDEILFHMELAYAGVAVVNIDPEQHAPICRVEVPRLLFPYVRAMATDLTRDAGIPPVVIPPIDFVALFREQMRRAAEEKQGISEDTETAGNA